MAQTNRTELSYAVQTGYTGTLPGTPDWRILERAELSAFGNTITKTEPSRITRNRNMRKKKTTALDSSVEMSAPLDFDTALEFGQGFIMAAASGPAFFTASAATATGVTIPAISAGDAAQIQAGQTLFELKGFANSANNGLKVANTQPSASDTEITITGGLTAETIAADKRAQIYIAGVRGATGDLGIDSNGDLVSTLLDFTALGLVVGQAIHLGGVDDVNTFSEVTNTGFAIIKSIAANKIELEKRDQAYTEETGAGLDVDILFGPYIRNYSIDHANFLRRYYMFGLKTEFLADEDVAAKTTYEYAKDNACDSLSIEFGSEFANLSLGFIGSSTDNPTETPATGQANAALLNKVAEFSTSTDLVRLSVEDLDESGLMTDFDSATLTVSNGLSARKVLGQLEAASINVGDIAVTLEATMLFTNPDIIERVRCNKEVSFRVPLWNEDGGMLFHIPKMTLEGGDRQYPENETVTINTTGSAHNNDADGSSIELSLFPLLPQRECV